MDLSPTFLFNRLRQLLKEAKYAPVERVMHSLLPIGKRAAWIHAYHQWKCARQPAIREQLNHILAQHRQARAVIVFTPGLNWHGQLFQRPQQLALALAKQGALVFYTQSTPLPGDAHFQVLAEGLYLCALSLDHFSNLGGAFVYSLTWNRKYLLKFSDPAVLYDVLDDLSAFEGQQAQLAHDHAALLAQAAVVMTTARRLLQAVQPTRPDALLVPNGVDFEHFNPVDAAWPIPPDLGALRVNARPLIGYYGAMAHWFDYDLLQAMAQERPDLTFVLIGSQHDHSLADSGLLGQSNVHYLGPKPYSDLPAYLACFDVAILPFKVNQITHSTSPVKLFEYFAGGKPVVSTPLQEVMQFPEVFIGASTTEFCAMLDAALAARTDHALINGLKAIAKANTWDLRAECILQALEAYQLRQHAPDGSISSPERSLH